MTAPASQPPQQRQSQGPVLDFFADLGPGLITGAADDDPSGIATYSVTGAAFGYGLLWTALFAFPMMAAVQLMCSRLGMITGRGLAAVVRRRYSRWVLWGACFVVNGGQVVHICAGLGGGWAGLVRRGCSGWVWWGPCLLLRVPIVINSGGDWGVFDHFGTR